MKSYIIFLLISSSISILLTLTHATPIESDVVARFPNSHPGRTLFSSLVIRDVVMSEETEIKCETSSGSPTVADANKVPNTLIGWGDDRCRQTNCFGSKCHDIAKEGTAAATICASCLVMIRCKYAGNSISSNIAEKCKSYVNGAWRARGQAIYSQGKAELYHT